MNVVFVVGFVVIVVIVVAVTQTIPYPVTVSRGVIATATTSPNTAPDAPAIDSNAVAWIRTRAAATAYP